MCPLSLPGNVAMILGCFRTGPQKSTYPAQEFSQQISQIQQGLNGAMLCEELLKMLFSFYPTSQNTSNTWLQGATNHISLSGSLFKSPSIKKHLKSNSLCIGIPWEDEVWKQRGQSEIKYGYSQPRFFWDSLDIKYSVLRGSMGLKG